MAQAVGHVGDEAVVDPVNAYVAVVVKHLLLEHLAQLLVAGHHVVYGLDGELHDVDVPHLVVSSHVVHFPFAALAHHHVDGLTVVFHIEPVAHVGALAVDGQPFALKNVVDDERNELLGEVVGPVVVGASGDAYGHVVGVAVGHDKEVGTRFRSRIGTVRTERSLLGEVAFGPQTSIHLVGGHLMVAFAGLPCGVSLRVLARDPSPSGSVEEVLRAEDVHAQEELRVFDGAVYMALGGKVHHIVDVVPGKEAVGQFAVAYVPLHEQAAAVVDVVLDGAEIAGVGECIENDHLDVFVPVFLVKQVFDVVRTDETCGTGH